MWAGVAVLPARPRSQPGPVRTAAAAAAAAARVRPGGARIQPARHRVPHRYTRHARLVTHAPAGATGVAGSGRYCATRACQRCRQDDRRRHGGGGCRRCPHLHPGDLGRWRWAAAHNEREAACGGRWSRAAAWAAAATASLKLERRSVQSFKPGTAAVPGGTQHTTLPAGHIVIATAYTQWHLIYGRRRHLARRGGAQRFRSTCGSAQPPPIAGAAACCTTARGAACRQPPKSDAP